MLLDAALLSFSKGAVRRSVACRSTLNGKNTVTRLPAKSAIVGTPISMTSYAEVLELIDRRPADTATVVSVCNVHSVMSARKDPELAIALRESDVATPDGVPLVWVMRWISNPEQQRVYGPTLMRLALVDEDRRQWSHYLYGSTNDTLTALVQNIGEFAPNARIVGQTAPPFRPLTEEEKRRDLEAIRASGADVVWVGLGMPKQEIWMRSVRDEIPGVALVGVGAAFDFLAGTVDQAPSWMMRAGLEWLYRVWKEPRRLWRRYVWNNPAYVALALRQIASARLGPQRRHRPSTD